MKALAFAPLSPGRCRLLLLMLLLLLLLPPVLDGQAVGLPLALRLLRSYSCRCHCRCQRRWQRRRVWHTKAGQCRHVLRVILFPTIFSWGHGRRAAVCSFR